MTEFCILEKPILVWNALKSKAHLNPSSSSLMMLIYNLFYCLSLLCTNDDNLFVLLFDDN